MKARELNVTIRTMIQQLISDNYKKHPICAITLGNQASPQFEKFLKGADLGIKPLERLVEGLGFDLCLVPVEREDKGALDSIDTTCAKFIDVARNNVVDYLDNRELAPRESGNGPVAKAFQDAALEMIDEL